MSSAAPRYRNVAVLAPSGSTTGGPELLHQLVHEIRRRGGNATIHYVPDPYAAVPERYRCYDTPPLRRLDLKKGDCIVAPETMLRELPLLTRADRYIWWLSFDFFESRRPGRMARLLANSYKTLLLHAQSLIGTGHLFQSHYARHRLRRFCIAGKLLSDYLAIEAPKNDVGPRQDIILYNPKKGMEVTALLRRHCPALEFLPIINMSKAEVEATLRRAKLYIDFGEHPGKDRLPREAAMMGTVVVVGARGSAAFDGDVGLPHQYKLALDADLPAKFASLAADILGDFQAHSRNQRGYRAVIASEYDVFVQQVQDVFFVADPPTFWRWQK